MDQDIKLIIKEKISLLLTAGDKIVTKNEEISLVAGFLCKGNKRRLPVRKSTKHNPHPWGRPYSDARKRTIT